MQPWQLQTLALEHQPVCMAAKDNTDLQLAIWTRDIQFTLSAHGAIAASHLHRMELRSDVLCKPGAMRG